MITRAAIERVQSNQERVQKSMDRVATGLRVERPSDDPVASAQVLETTSRIEAATQHQRNVERGRHRLSVEEQALDALTNVIARAREIATQQGNNPSDPTGRQVSVTEVQGLIDTAIGLGNTRFGDTFLFGGGHAMSAPFASDGTTSASAPPVGSHRIEIASGSFAETTHDGMTAFVSSGAISALQTLHAALTGGNATAINTAATSLDGALDEVQELIGEIGIRTQVLETARGTAEELELDLREMRSDVSEVELDQAITELLGHQSALEAALLAISRVQTRSLAELI